MTKLNFLTFNTKLLQDTILNSQINFKYLIMSQETFNIIKNIIPNPKYEPKSYLSNNQNYYSYCGVPIAICNLLESGEVEFIHEHHYD